MKSKYFLLFFVFLSGFSKADLSDAEIYRLIKLHFKFPKDMRHLSPLNGVSVLKSGLLSGIRFHGAYAEKYRGYPRQRQISNDQDYPQDKTTAIIQHLFPSPAGDMLAISGSGMDFFHRASIDNLFRILFDYSNDSLSLDTFELSNTNKKSLKSSWYKLKTEKDGDVFDVWYEGIKNQYLDLFLRAKFETEAYPPHIVEAALLALAVKKANSATDLLKYTQWKLKLSLKETELGAFYEQNQRFVNLMVNYEKWILGAKSKLTYAETASVTYNGTSFGDCGETSLRNFFNSMLMDDERGEFDLDLLRKAFPGADGLIEFFENYQPTYKEVPQKDARNAWAGLVSRQPGVAYLKGEGTCEMGAGLSNMLALLRALLKDPKLDDGLTEEAQLDLIFERFSVPGKKLDWSIKGKKQVPEEGAMLLKISRNKIPSFQWYILENHFQFTPLYSDDSENEWGESKPIQLFNLYKQDPDSILVYAPYFNHDEINDFLIQNMVQGWLDEKKFLPIFLYMGGAKGTESQINLLESFRGMSNHPAVQKIAQSWIDKVPDDEHFISRVTNMMYHYKYLDQKGILRRFFMFRKTLFESYVIKLEQWNNNSVDIFKKGFQPLYNFNSDRQLLNSIDETVPYNFHQLFNKYSDKLFKNKKNLVEYGKYLGLVKNMLLRMDDLTEPSNAAGMIHDLCAYDGDEYLCNSELELLNELVDNIRDLADERLFLDENGQTFVHLIANRLVSDGRNQVQAMRIFKGKMPHLLIDPRFIRDGNGQTALHLAIKNNNHNLVEYLVSEEPHLLDDIYAQDFNGNTLAKMALESKNPGIMVLILKDSASKLVDQVGNKVKGFFGSLFDRNFMN